MSKYRALLTSLCKKSAGVLVGRISSISSIPYSLIELIGTYFISKNPELDGTIYDESTKGDTRTVQPGRAYLGDGVDDSLDWVISDVGTLYISYYNITSGSWVDTSMTHNGTKYSFSLPAAKVYNIKIWTDNLASSEDKQANLLDSIPANLWAWLKCDDIHPYKAYDSSGNANHAFKVGPISDTFHYEGSDVPYSWMNSVGYSWSLVS